MGRSCCGRRTRRWIYLSESRISGEHRFHRLGICQHNESTNVADKHTVHNGRRSSSHGTEPQFLGRRGCVGRWSSNLAETKSCNSHAQPLDFTTAPLSTLFLYTRVVDTRDRRVVRNAWFGYTCGPRLLLFPLRLWIVSQSLYSLGLGLRRFFRCFEIDVLRDDLLRPEFRCCLLGSKDVRLACAASCQR